MPFKIVLHAPHGALDQITVRKDKDLKKELHKAIEDWELSDGDSITLFKVTDIEVGTDDMFEGIIADLRSRK